METTNPETASVPVDGQSVLTVSELTSCIKETMEHDYPDLYVQGEISQFTRASSGHVYLTLKDERAVLKAILWNSIVRRIRFDIEEGMEVVCRGGIDVYPPRGTYQLIVREMHPCGVGALQLAFRQLVQRLEKEGLFAAEHKKELPAFPEKIGLVTSQSGAAVRDIIRIIKRRWPVATVCLLPTPVQGKEAAAQIAGAVRLLNRKRSDLDVLIVGRGGGSLEDLWPFNEECVARAIFESAIPVVSAVGHEVDFSVSDFVSDMRAATPSEAGENTVPSRQEVLSRTGQLARRLAQALLGKVKREKQHLNSLVNRPVIRRPETLLQEKIQRTDELLEKINSALIQGTDSKKQSMQSLYGRLEALSPLKVLQRGYSITFGPDGAPLMDARQIRKGDRIKTRLHGGSLNSKVEKIEPK